jgi:DNA adenine methylase
MKRIKNLNIFILIMNNTSPLRYPGGKTRACKILENIVKENYDMSKFSNIVSPFFGGGSFEFHLQTNFELPIFANDKFTPLYNFWNFCKNDNDHLVSELRNVKPDKELFTLYRRDILTDTHFNQAFKYFVINRCSFSGATLSGGFSLESSKKRFTPSSIDRISNLDLSHVSFYNLDFEEFLTLVPNEHSFIFLDPPYYLEKKSKLYGNNGDLHEEFQHEKLYDVLKEKTNWLLSYNDHPKIRELYRDMKIIEVDWKYGMNKTKESSEIVILSTSGI